MFVCKRKTFVVVIVVCVCATKLSKRNHTLRTYGWSAKRKHSFHAEDGGGEFNFIIKHIKNAAKLIMEVKVYDVQGASAYGRK